MLLNILLINPPLDWPDDTRLNSIFFQPVQSLGLGYIAAVLENEGYTVDVLECSAIGLNIKNIIGIIKNKEYSIIGLSVFIYNYYHSALIGNNVKKLFPNIKLVLGGFLPTLSPNEMFASIPGLDYCVLGEGEYTFLNLIRSIDSPTTIVETNGIAYKRNDEIIINGCSEVITHLDSLPFPKISYISPSGMAAIISGRGCHGRCSFCSVEAYRGKIKGKYCRKRDPMQIIKEIEMLVHEHKVKIISFHDDSFLSVKELWLVNFIQSMKQSQLNILFSFSARADDIIRFQKYMPELKEMGLTYIFIGVESFVPRQLELYNKNISSEENRKAIEIIEECNISYGLGLILIDPFVCLDEIEYNLNVLNEIRYPEHCNSDNPPISLLSPLFSVKYSQIESMLKNKGLYVKNEYGYEIIDNLSKRYFKISKMWVSQLVLVHNKSFLDGDAYFGGYFKTAKRLKLLKKQIKVIDLNFCLSLCQYVKNNPEDKEVISFLSPWFEKINIISTEINEIYNNRKIVG
jgi:radical SAM superfamily enzyme YgiQ (UPF0313 family)